MPTPTEVLKHEHDAIEELLRALDGMAQRVREGEVPVLDLETAFHVATEFADRRHHAKEEEVLFPVLTEASERGAYLARRLTADHQAMRKLVAHLRDLLPRTRRPDAREDLAKSLEAYGRLLREHIRVENEELLPETTARLSEEELARVAEAFERVDAEVGPETDEDHRAAIWDLVSRYGV